MIRFFENIAVAFSAIRMNALRATLTIFIIAFGIMALVSMLTAVDGIKYALENNFAQVGSNTFNINNQMEVKGNRGGRWNEKDFDAITYKQARAFQQRFEHSATVSLSFQASGSAVVQYGSIKTNPKVNIPAGDENTLRTSGLQLEEGRNFSAEEVSSGRHVTIIGASLKDELFGPQNAIGKTINIENQPYLVIGLLKSKGSSFGSNQDETAVITLTAARNQFTPENLSYEIDVLVPDVALMDNIVNEATGIFRSIRLLTLYQENNFTVAKNDSLDDSLLGLVGILRTIGVLIGMITLIGASVGLTNIMLVSVTERTREIGVRKAIGANNGAIRRQFLSEAIVICQTGGLLGIVLGVLLGNLVSLYFNSPFFLPWLWIIIGIILCLIVGVVSGYYPANKAAQMDPIESLRHE